MGLFSTFISKKQSSSTAVSPSGSSHGSDDLKDHGLITKTEFERVVRRLRGDMGNFKIQRLKDTAAGFADADYGKKGISAREAKELLNHVEKNRHKFDLTDEDISDFKNALNKEL